LGRYPLASVRNICLAFVDHLGSMVLDEITTPGGRAEQTPEECPVGALRVTHGIRLTRLTNIPGEERGWSR